MMPCIVNLQHGRTLTVEDQPDAQVVELRSGSGALELRLKLTEDGVVLQLEGARISLKAEQSIDLDCNTLNLNADSDIRIQGARVFIN